MNPAIDTFIEQADRWQDVMRKLRSILLSCGLTEEIKWNQPCYTFEDANIVIIGDFSTGCRLTFFKGVLLSDPKKHLRKPGPNTRSARLLEFTNVEEVEALESTIRVFVRQAIQNEKDGLEVDFEKNRQPDIPDEFQTKLDEDPALQVAFQALTPGRQRAYLLYFNGAKQSKTRSARVEKYIPKILAGKGMRDQ
jgi:uncharacterized protein YdeI (YjbR/CyaY-like superfamily)